MFFKLAKVSAIVAVLLFGVTPVQAGLPGSVWGRVEIELPDGTRMPAPGVVLFRTDWWRWSYCGMGGRQSSSCKMDINGVITDTVCCFGDQDGVEVITGTDGSYSMANDGNNPLPVDRCNTPEFDGGTGGAKRCLSGPKGSVPKTDDGRSCFGYNWCGLNCGSNPHRIEPYLPEGYSLPGNLEQLGYSTQSATFQPGLIDIKTANDENKGPFDFKVILQAAPSPTPDIHQQSQKEQQKLIEQAYNPSPTFTPAPTGYLGLTNAEFEAKIAAWKEGSITTEQMSLFVTRLARTPGLQSTNCNPEDGGCEVY